LGYLPPLIFECIYRLVLSLNIHSKVRASILENSKKIKEAVRSSDVTPKHVAIRLLLDTSEDYLTSGENHVYRGALNGKGQATFKLFKHYLNEANKYGMCDDSTVNSAIVNVEEQIKHLG
jgi:hypothetical protein